MSIKMLKGNACISMFDNCMVACSKLGVYPTLPYHTLRHVARDEMDQAPSLFFYTVQKAGPNWLLYTVLATLHAFYFWLYFRTKMENAKFYLPRINDIYFMPMHFKILDIMFTLEIFTLYSRLGVYNIYPWKVYG